MTQINIRKLAEHLISSNAYVAYSVERVEEMLLGFAEESTRLADFRAHAIALNSCGATRVDVGDMSVTFGPRPAPPLTAEAVAVALATKQDAAAPEGDDAYVP